MINVLLVGAGGFVGSALRYITTEMVHRAIPRHLFPAGTLTVNILGCLALGFFVGAGEIRHVMGQRARMLMLVGAMGGFTTFSTFASESYFLLDAGRVAAGVLNASIQVGVGLLAVWAGLTLSRLLLIT